MESVIARILRGGVALSITMVMTGMVVMLREGIESPLSTGGRIVMAGLFVLIATPVMRVAASIALFASERDRVYVVITAVVLFLLILSFVIGAAE